MTPSLSLNAAAGTNAGRVHPVNQDSVLSAINDDGEGSPVGLFIVADGMGGHQAGEVASKLAVEKIRNELSWLLEPTDAEDTQPSLPTPLDTTVVEDVPAQLKQRLRLAVEQANHAIARHSQDDPSNAGNMGTTITCLLVQGNVAVVGNVGDSRTYRLRNDTFSQLTRDHSYVAQLVASGELAPEEVFTHPRRNVITRSLGYQPDVKVDLETHAIQPGDRYLLCSDGLWEMVREPAAMATYLQEQADPDKAVQKLIDLANENGGADNIGVVVVHVNG